MYSRVGDAFRSNARTDASEATSDSLEEILDDPHCRHLLEHLRREGDRIPESTLARHVVAGITDTPPEEVPDDVHRRVQTWLHHGQLPVLDEYGVVEFDADSGEVTLERNG